MLKKSERSRLVSLILAVVFLSIGMLSAPGLTLPVTGQALTQAVYLPALLKPKPLPTETPTRIPTDVPTPLPTAAATALPGSRPFRFISWADTKSGTSILASLSRQVKAFNPAFTIFPGDLESAGFTSSGMSSWIKALDGNASNGMAEITFPVRGNHDASNTSSWQSYFHMSSLVPGVGATNYTALDADLTYSFDYENSHFLAVDVPGDADTLTSRQLTFIDSDLAAAESRGLEHAFLYFHGPLYPVSSHNDCSSRVCTPPSDVTSLVNIIDKHPIVSAIFNGHEHLLAYVHIDSTRIPAAGHQFEQFIIGAAGAGLNTCDQTYRYDWCSSNQGFGVVDVDGPAFSVSIYRQGQTTPIKVYHFEK